MSFVGASEGKKSRLSRERGVFRFGDFCFEKMCVSFLDSGWTGSFPHTHTQTEIIFKKNPRAGPKKKKSFHCKL